MKTSAALALAAVLGLTLPASAGQAPRVSEVGGNIVWVGPDGVAETVLSSGKDSEPVLSPDGQQIAFVREEGGPEVGAYGQPGNAVWLLDLRTGKARRLLGWVNGHSMTSQVSRLTRPVFSLDGGFLYVECDTWVTSNAVHQISLKTGAHRYVIDGNGKLVIRNGPYRGYLLVQRHKYYGPPDYGSYNPVDLVRPDGKVILTVPDSDDNDAAVAAWLAKRGWTAG